MASASHARARRRVRGHVCTPLLCNTRGTHTHPHPLTHIAVSRALVCVCTHTRHPLYVGYTHTHTPGHDAHPRRSRGGQGDVAFVVVTARDTGRRRRRGTTTTTVGHRCARVCCVYTYIPYNQPTDETIETIETIDRLDYSNRIESNRIKSIVGVCAGDG